MSTSFSTFVMRRAVLQAASWAGLSLVGRALAEPPGRSASDDARAEDNETIKRLIGGAATESARVHLQMPAVFGDGYRVPLTLAIDSPMTEADHVRLVHVIAPKNPIIVVARFRFVPQSGRAAISTRIRLAQPQTVLAVAEMNDGALLMARTWVKVETDGCA